MRKTFITVGELVGLGSVNFVDATAVPAQPPGVKTPLGLSQFIESRIKGSVYADLDTCLSGPETATSGRHPLPDPKVFISWIQRAGIDNGRPVVAYDRMGGALAAARAWWMFDNLGLESYILEGGFQQYAAAGLPTQSGEPAPLGDQPSGRPWKYRTSFHNTVDIGELDQHFVIEARSLARVNSTVRPMHPVDPVPGSIPNSGSYEFTQNFVPERNFVLQPTQRLKAQLVNALEGRDANDVVMSCGSGVTACHNIAVSQHLGLGVPKLYVGSFSQYSKLKKDAMVERVLKTHGMLIQLENFLVEGRSATAKDVTSTKGTATPDEVRTALRELRAGEVANVIFANGNKCRIETKIGASL